jgi:uncharacterized protein
MVHVTGDGVEFKVVKIHKPEDVNFILGQSHLIKTVEDIAEAVVGSVAGAKFGLAFSEASGECLIRIDGNDGDLIALARYNPKVIGAGNSFILFLRDCYAVDVLNEIKSLNEVCAIYCATANASEIVIAELLQGRGIMGVIDVQKPQGVEGPEDVRGWITQLRKFGYKRG